MVRAGIQETARGRPERKLRLEKGSRRALPGTTEPNLEGTKYSREW